MAPERRRDQEHDANGYLPIEQHGVIGDLHTVALVGSEGTIDWFCPERFDAPSMFCAILDSAKGGRFAIRPVNAEFTTKQLYLPGTAVLVTRFFTEDGVGEVVDFMPLGPGSCTIIRRIEVVRGSVRFRVVRAAGLRLRARRHRLVAEDALATFLAGDSTCEPHAVDGTLEAEGGAAVAEVTLSRGDRRLLRALGRVGERLRRPDRNSPQVRGAARTLRGGGPRSRGDRALDPSERQRRGRRAWPDRRSVRRARRRPPALRASSSVSGMSMTRRLSRRSAETSCPSCATSEHPTVGYSPGVSHGDTMTP